MPIDIESIKAAYDKLVEEGLAEFQADNVLEVVKRYSSMRTSRRSRSSLP